VEEIEDEDAPLRNIPVLKTTNHSCLTSTKVEAPELTQRATTLEVVDDKDTLKERKGLSQTLPVLMDLDDSLTIDDIEEIVDRVSTVPVILGEDAAATLEDLHEIDELVQEFTCVRYPRRSYNESTAPRNDPTPSEPITANKLDINEALRAVTEAHTKEVKQMGTLTEDDIPELRAKWLQSCQDIMNGVLEELPPMRGVNHHIPLIDENKQYHYHLLQCPDSMKVQLMEKITRYMQAGWRESVQTDQAAPMLCIPKKSGLLRTAIDAHKQNDNTVKDVMPFPDQV
jgi:nicotinic acid mononucleotide adenylyltransferase